MAVKQEYASRRLSKPRTNNNSSSNLLSHFNDDSPNATIKSASPDLEYSVENGMSDNAGDARSRRLSRHAIRSYIYGSHRESSNSMSSDEEDERSSPSISHVARTARRKLSRTGSSFMQLSSTRSSLTRSSESSKQPASDDSEESAVVAAQVKQRAYQDSITARNHVSSPIDDDKHVDSVLAPVRRKSLYTPGIATRNVSDILRKPPTQARIPSNLSQAERDYYYNPAHPEHSPLDALSKLHSIDDDRCSTPNLHVPSLGGLSMGSLRVMNGTSSPEPPSLGSPNVSLTRSTSSTGHEDFHTASEGSDVGEADIPQLYEAIAVAIGGEASQRPVEQLPESPIQDTASRIYDDADHMYCDVPGCASSMADTYMAELAPVPFSRCSSVNQQPSSGRPHQAHILQRQPSICYECDSFERPSDSGADAPLNPRDMAFERLNGESQRLSESQRHSTPISVISQQCEIAYPNHQADSGCHSSGSVCTYATDPSTPLTYEASRFSQNYSSTTNESFPNTPLKVDMPADAHEPQESVTAIPASVSVQPRSTASLATTSRALEDEMPDRPRLRECTSRGVIRKLRARSRSKSRGTLTQYSQPAISMTHANDLHQLSEAQIPRVPSLMAARHAERHKSFPLLDHTFPSSDHTTRCSSPFATEPRPAILPSPTKTQASSMSQDSLDYDQRCSRASIPSSDDDRVHTNGGQSSSWSRQSRNQKPKQLQSRERHARLQDVEATTQEVRSTHGQISHDDGEDSDFGEQRTPRTRTRSRSRSRVQSWIRRKSSEQQDIDMRSRTMPIDFGDVAASLGSSPYDIATAIHPNALRDLSGSHPHQLSASMQRPRSILLNGSDESDDNLSLQNILPEQHGGRSRRGSGAWPLSSPIETRPRPQTMCGNAPPVPALSAVDVTMHNLDWQKKQQRRRSQSLGRSILKTQFTEGVNAIDHENMQRPLRPQSTVIQTSGPTTRSSSSFGYDRRDNTVRDAPVHPKPYSLEEKALPPPPPENELEVAAEPAAQRDMSKMVLPSLWSNGSLEKKSVPSRSSQSAVKAEAPVPAPLGICKRESMQSTPLESSARVTPINTPSPPASGPRHSASYFDPQYTQTAARQSPTPAVVQWIPRKRVGSGIRTSVATTTPHGQSLNQMMAGRYNGGLEYGYEPGSGLGGSAGTRYDQTAASRKSVQMSRGYGVDLSDVPVFVAPVAIRC